MNARIKAAFPGHEVRTVGEIGRRASSDEELLRFAAHSFDAFVTIDRRLPRENQIRGLALGVILIRVPNSTLAAYRPLFAKLARAVEIVRPGQVLEVG